MLTRAAPKLTATARERARGEYVAELLIRRLRHRNAGPGQNGFEEILFVLVLLGASRRTVRPAEPNPAKVQAEHPHTLNGSNLAAGRTWVAIIENRQALGSVVVSRSPAPVPGAGVIRVRGWHGVTSLLLQRRCPVHNHVVRR